MHRDDFDDGPSRDTMLITHKLVLCFAPQDKISARLSLAFLVGCNDSEPVPDIVLFQELLCQILEIPVQA